MYLRTKVCNTIIHSIPTPYIYLKSLDINVIKSPIIIPISFGILSSFLLFLIIINIFPNIIKVSAVLISILLTIALKAIYVTKTIDMGINTNKAAIIYNTELNLLVLILNSPLSNNYS